MRRPARLSPHRRLRRQTDRLGRKDPAPAVPPTKWGERAAGALLALTVAAVCTALPALLLRALYARSFWTGLAAESFFCYQLLAARSLRDESRKVAAALEAGDLQSARYWLSMIVGRDTEFLDETGVVEAAVETVAENTADGVVAPLFWTGLFGVPGGCFCKAVNTMDSMIGYKNERYRRFGTAAARLDDFVNFIPARLAGLLMVAAAGLCRFDMANAWRIFRRDRLRHASPNSAHAEAACAGALRVQLAGPASYGGQVEAKPFLGDPLRPVETADIARAHKLLFATAALSFFFALALRLLIVRGF
ncbi:adenosylcobinamide-phosphate synthase CbiB [Pyramidobacter sp. YE332]|uniref:adenosylcobinamide-phosphate synthase CbiB n=1 Tax=Pyramidobacter sp. YE332 TaxID=3068894 RepID=UPI00294B12F3|nr:adenosylcobinamide-phosphate synthase CbiB [Pyramidobacter sp. YE332]WOL39951.1 adenosylcobinamide-phosphate synthase CbiB [Pyramidobacter sp. YE332]